MSCLTEPKLDELLLWKDFNDSTYYKAILQNLFFATLNQEMNTAKKPENRKFRREASEWTGSTFYDPQCLSV